MMKKSLSLVAAAALLSGCVGGNGLDWDLRGGRGALDTTPGGMAGAPQGGLIGTAPAGQPQPDARGVVTYPNYQLVQARPGDTIATIAGRIGLAPAVLAQHNAMRLTDSFRGGELLAIPGRLAPLPGGPGALIPGQATMPGGVATTTLGGPAPAAAPGTAGSGIGGEAIRHTVARGETAFTIARMYNVSAKALAQWNRLDANLNVQEGQTLIIPNAVPAPLPDATASAPGAGSATPTPPSSKKPLPAEKTKTAKEAAKEAAAPVADLGSTRTKASASAFAMPLSGKIIRGYQKKKNDGIDIAAPAGTAVAAAASGTVAAVTKDTKGVPIVVIKHEGGMLTVYAGLDGLKVRKGDKVKRGQTIASVRAGDPAFVHFEIRKGTESLDPMPYLQ